MTSRFAHIVVVSTLLAGNVALANGQPDEVQSLITQWKEQNTLCRGLHGDDPRMPVACDARQELGRKIDALGWCYGRKGELGYQMVWHRCGPDSERYE